MGQAAATPVSCEDTFQLKNGVVIKGGYAGFGEPDPNARDIEKYKTILSGDLLGNDVGDFTDFSKWENSYHVVTGSGCDETAILDGFTITAGNDHRTGDYYPIGHGAGMLNESGSPTVSNCTFTDNYASDTGGGMFNETGSPTLTNCTFIGNSAGGFGGGGMFNWESDPIVTNCRFISNSASGYGGAIYNYFRCSPILSKCIFSGNSASDGGGIHNSQRCSLTLTNCIFTGNSAIGENGVGGGMCNYDSRETLTNCTFAGNKANRYGGSVANYRFATTILKNCILWDGEDGIYNTYDSYIMITYSDVQGSWPGEGNIDADPCFVEPEYFGPVSYWKFDEAVGTTAFDSVGQNHGNVYGAQWTSGQVSSALDFDGLNDHVNIPYDPSLNINAPDGITFSLWTKFNSYPSSLNQGPIFGLYYSAGMGTKNYLSIMKSIYGNVISWDQCPPAYGWLGSIKPDLDAWYHLAVVEESSYRAIYINGSLDASDNTPELYQGNPPDTIRIGSRADGLATYYFDGIIDNLIVFDRALSAEEIEQLYQNGFVDGP